MKNILSENHFVQSLPENKVYSGLLIRACMKYKYVSLILSNILSWLLSFKNLYSGQNQSTDLFFNQLCTQGHC